MKSDMLGHVRRAFAAVLQRQGYVSVVDVLVEMQRLRPANLEGWRFGQVPYLERIVEGNLSKLSLIGREVRNIAQAQGLTPSVTVYRTFMIGTTTLGSFTGAGSVPIACALVSSPWAFAASSPPHSSG